MSSVRTAGRLGSLPSRPAALAATLAALLLAPSAADAIPERWTRAPASGPPGVTIAVSGSGCIQDGKPYDDASLLMFLQAGQAGHPFVLYETYDVAPDGTWTGPFPVPTDAPGGEYVMRASCHAGDAVFPYPTTHPFRVIRPAATSAPPRTPPPTRTPRPTRTSRPRPRPTPTPTPSRTAPTTPTPTATTATRTPTATPSPVALPRAGGGGIPGPVLVAGALAVSAALGFFSVRRHP